jgi:hypothetical protein
MRVERVEDAIIIRAGTGEWYNQRVWGMLEDDGLPPALWHADVDAAIRSCELCPPLVVVDTTEMIWLAPQDYGFFAELSKRLKSIGIKLVIVAPPNEVRAWVILRPSLQQHFNVVGTLNEALTAK